MPISINNCFYCQSLGGLASFPTYGKCGFCGSRAAPLYLVNYEKQKKYFCCGCAWWQYPRSGEEKRAENE